jgi:hypothetical protein
LNAKPESERTGTVEFEYRAAEVKTRVADWAPVLFHRCLERLT